MTAVAADEAGEGVGVLWMVHFGWGWAVLQHIIDPSDFVNWTVPPPKKKKKLTYI